VESISPAGANSAGSGTGTMNVMRAIRIHRRGGPETLIYEDVPIPALRPGDALVRVHAAAISPAEFTWRLYETPDGRSRLPKIPSHEVSGRRGGCRTGRTRRGGRRYRLWADRFFTGRRGRRIRGRTRRRPRPETPQPRSLERRDSPALRPGGLAGPLRCRRRPRHRGGTVTERSWSVLRRNGLRVTIVRPRSPEWAAGRAATGVFFIVEPRRAQLNELSRLIDAGTIRPIVEAVLPLNRAREAYERGIRDHPRGKLVLTVVDEQ